MVWGSFSRRRFTPTKRVSSYSVSATSSNLLRNTPLFHLSTRPSGVVDDNTGSEVPSRGSKRPLTGASVFRDVLNGLSLHEFIPKLEPFIQKVVREEVEHAISRLNHSPVRFSHNQIESCRVRVLHLHFDGKIPSTLFTGSRIESDDSEPVKIVLLDPYSKNIISSGALSSIKIEIVVLDGDFGADDQEDWTEKEFNANVVREREGKRPLVTGDLVITLRNGVGCIGDISFTDNSSWIRGRKFRLGVRPVQSVSGDVRIREARSEAFVVKDHRGESYKKHHPPRLVDEIWRLERIAKDGAFHKRLDSYGIRSVKEFLQLYVTDPLSLRNIFGSGISNKKWDTIIEHAMSCVLDDKLYVYYWAAESVGLLFNSIYKVVAATFDGHNYQSLDKLDISHLRWVENLKQDAYKNLNDLIPIDEPSVVGLARPLLSLQADTLGLPSLDMQHVNFPVAHQDEPQMQLNFNHTTPRCTFAVGDSSQLEAPMAQSCHPTHMFTPTLRNNFMMRNYCSGQNSAGNFCTPSGPLGPVVQAGHLAADDASQVETPAWLPVTTTLGRGNGVFLAPSIEADFGITSSFPNFGIHPSKNGNGKPKAWWCKIRAALKWGISVRRDAAAKRMEKLLRLDF